MTGSKVLCEQGVHKSSIRIFWRFLPGGTPASDYQTQNFHFQEGMEMPEPPKQGFFKGFFGGGAKPLDREELFGGSNASSTIAVKTEGAKMTAAQVRP